MISDEELILYYYREVDDAERARIGAALAEQPELAQRLHRLVAKLDAAAAIPEVPVPAEAMQRWRTALDQAAQTKRHANKPRFTRTPWLAAAAVVLVAIIAVIQQREPATTPQTAQVAPPPPAAPTSSSYERGLQSHLATTERQLASLDSATPEERARLVETIIEQNRLYAQAAEKAGEPQLARVLRAFSPVLEGLQQGNDTSASLDQLAFELRVMQGRLGAAPASPTQSTTL